MSVSVMLRDFGDQRGIRGNLLGMPLRVVVLRVDGECQGGNRVENGLRETFRALRGQWALWVYRPESRW